MEDRKVRDVMTTEIRGISEGASLQTAADIMVEKGINSLVVWPLEKDEPYGIVTSSDIVDAIAGGKPLAESRVADLRSAPLVVVTPGVRLVDAARMMSRYGLRHLAIFNGRELVGIVSNRDILKGIVGPVEVREREAVIP
jgi:IMP dehydrogenase